MRQSRPFPFHLGNTGFAGRARGSKAPPKVLTLMTWSADETFLKGAALAEIVKAKLSDYGTLEFARVSD